ncbi:MAG TPA: SET domain-containing protein [Polyangiaceae bacterium]|jgi:SET domain-containing protein
MPNSPLEVRQTERKGRGVFAARPIPRGMLVAVCSGQLRRTDELPAHELAMQVGEDLWLCSPGDAIDDCFNHSCDPNIGFITGEPALYALRQIEPGEELCWDYSTSLSETAWTLACLCDSPRCRGTVQSFPELASDDQERLLPIALQYIRDARARCSRTHSK